MFDEIAIQKTISTYSEACSRKDWDLATSMFTSDGVWDLVREEKRFVGKASIRQALPSFVSPMAYFVQINAPAVIDVEHDLATARSAVREGGKFADRDQAIEYYGTYHDRLIRTSDGWRFILRTWTTEGSHVVPVLTGARSS